MVQILAKVCSFYTIVKKCAAEFEQDGNNTEDDLWPGRPKTSTPDEQVDAFHYIVFDTDDF